MPPKKNKRNTRKINKPKTSSIKAKGIDLSVIQSLFPNLYNMF